MNDEFHPPPDPPITIIILEDQWFAQKALAWEVETRMGATVICRTDDPDTVANAAERHQPDVAIIDLMIHGSLDEGFRALAGVAAASPKTRCVVLTAYPNLSTFRRAIRLGAIAFVDKNTRGDDPDLVQVIRQVLRGEPWHDQQLLLHLHRESRIGNTDQPRPNLTRMQTTVFRVLRREPHLTAREIADELVLSRRTVEHHIADACRRLGAENRAEALWIANFHGLLDDDSALRG